MDSGKENDALLFQQGLPSAPSRIQDVKNVLGGNRKAAESTRRKPLGSVQNICASSANEDKAKMQKKSLKDVDNYKKQTMSSGCLPTVDLQPDSFGQNVGSVATNAISQCAEYDDTERMHREIAADDDFSDLCGLAEQPTSFINSLRCWYPCEPAPPSPPPEYSVSPVSPPDWRRMHTGAEERVKEPLLPEFRLLNDFDFDF